MPATTTKVPPKVKPAPHPKPVIELIPLDKLIPTKDNRRQPITKESVQSLAQSIAQSGVLQPIIVRPHPSRKGFFEIRAGERRWQAAKMAKVAKIPAIIRSATDEQALAITLAENLDREDLHPLERAATIQLAFDRGHDLEVLAQQLGTPVKRLARWASLTRLTKAWQSQILQPESEVSQLSVAHLELIARLPSETQDAMAEDNFDRVFGHGFPTVKELGRIIDRDLHSLSAMPWRPDDAVLDPKAGACLSCPKRSGSQPLLFDDVSDDPAKKRAASKNDRCLDAACFDRKLAAHLKGCEAVLRREHPDLKLVQLTVGGLREATHAAFADRLTRVGLGTIVKVGSRNAVPVMPVDGPTAGKLVFLDSGHASGTTNGKPKRPLGANGKPQPLTMAERQAKLQQRRDAYLVRAVETRLRDLKPADFTRIAQAFARRKDEVAKGFHGQALMLAFGVSIRHDSIRDEGEAWKSYDQYAKQADSALHAKTLEATMSVWLRRLSGTDGSIAALQAADARRMCQILEIDAAAIAAEAVKAIPTPKSWGRRG